MMGGLVRDGTVDEAATYTAASLEAEGPVRGVVSSTLWLEARGLEERRYLWLEDHLERLEGKEARGEYYARLG